MLAGAPGRKSEPRANPQRGRKSELGANLRRRRKSEPGANLRQGRKSKPGAILRCEADCAHGLDQRLRGRGGRGFVLALEAPREILVGAQRAGAVARPGEKRDESADRLLVVWCELDGATGVGRGGGEIAGRRLFLGHGPGGARGRVPQPRALLLHPALQVGSVIHENAVQQIPVIELDRLGAALLPHRLAERGGVAPEPGRVDPQLILAARDEDIGAEPLAQVINRLA